MKTILILLALAANAQAELKTPSFHATGSSQIDSSLQSYYLVAGTKGTRLDALKGALNEKPVYRCQLQEFSDKGTLRNVKATRN